MEKPCWSLFNKVGGLKVCNFIKKTYFSDSNGTWTYNHLICKWTLNHLGKQVLSCRKFENFKKTFFTEHLWWLQLKLVRTSENYASW